jgi:hypothetical protein
MPKNEDRIVRKQACSSQIDSRSCRDRNCLVDFSATSDNLQSQSFRLASSDFGDEIIFHKSITAVPFSFGNAVLLEPGQLKSSFAYTLVFGLKSVICTTTKALKPFQISSKA